MQSIYVYPAGFVLLADGINQIPQPYTPAGAWDGYQLYKTVNRIYAVEQKGYAKRTIKEQKFGIGDIKPQEQDIIKHMFVSGYNYVIVRKYTSKIRLIGCVSEEKARRFLRYKNSIILNRFDVCT